MKLRAKSNPARGFPSSLKIVKQKVKSKQTLTEYRKAFRLELHRKGIDIDPVDSADFTYQEHNAGVPVGTAAMHFADMVKRGHYKKNPTEFSRKTSPKQKLVKVELWYLTRSKAGLYTILHGKVENRDYELVWKEDLFPTQYDDTATCEDVFEEFNTHRAGLRVRSMTTGDIVVVNGNAYRAAPVGWESVPTFQSKRKSNPKATRKANPSELQGYYDSFSQGHWASRNKRKCACRGSGWTLSDVDTWHKCPVHYVEGQHDPFDDEGCDCGQKPCIYYSRQKLRARAAVFSERKNRPHPLHRQEAAEDDDIPFLGGLGQLWYTLSRGSERKLGRAAVPEGRDQEGRSRHAGKPLSPARASGRHARLACSRWLSAEQGQAFCESARSKGPQARSLVEPP